MGTPNHPKTELGDDGPWVAAVLVSERAGHPTELEIFDLVAGVECSGEQGAAEVVRHFLDGLALPQIYQADGVRGEQVARDSVERLAARLGATPDRVGRPIYTPQMTPVSWDAPFGTAPVLRVSADNDEVLAQPSLEC